MIPPDDEDAIEITDDEEDDLTLMQAVKNLVAEKPNLSRWFVSSPELMKQQAKAKQRKENKKKQKEREQVADEEESPKERKKKKRKLTNDDEDDEDELTAYIRVLKPQPPPPPRLFDPDSTTFDDFMSLMSDALPCPVANIVLDKTEWKPQTPMNHAFLPLGGTGGFGALKKQMKKSKDKTLIIVMPGPRKPADNLPGDDGVGGGAGEAGPSNAGANKAFDFSQLETTSTEDSVEQQKLTFDQAIASHIEELQERWPVNEAGQRIYTDDKGFK
ncbi:hypothetical protein B0H16DRAFT_1711282 [Mycena metata]|uniref:Uncharacterized protein n=1 Tax=Mycena metata TaxID=1033252 RepID=A0AAD7K5T5_9AGAR|nr:hypothetical protein B0H16DRAFT_1711282 [Mycena metata]